MFYFVNEGDFLTVSWLFDAFAGFYNLSMGFRRDADLPCPYGYTIKRPVPRTDDQMKSFVLLT